MEATIDESGRIGDLLGELFDELPRPEHSQAAEVKTPARRQAPLGGHG